jgi:hypothetical protein
VGVGKGIMKWWRWKYFVFTYENRTIKPIEIVLRRGAERIKEKDGGGESN